MSFSLISPAAIADTEGEKVRVKPPGDAPPQGADFNAVGLARSCGMGGACCRRGGRMRPAASQGCVIRTAQPSLSPDSGTGESVRRRTGSCDCAGRITSGTILQWHASDRTSGPCHQRRSSWRSRACAHTPAGQCAAQPDGDAELPARNAWAGARPRASTRQAGALVARLSACTRNR